MKKTTPKNNKILSAIKSKEYHLIKETFVKNQEFFQLLLKHELFEIAEKWNKLFEINANTIISIAEMLEENKINHSENMNKLIIYTLEEQLKNLEKLSSYKKHLNKDSKEIDLFVKATEIFQDLPSIPKGKKANISKNMETALKDAINLLNYPDGFSINLFDRFKVHLRK